MRTFLGLVVTVGLIAAVVLKKQSEPEQPKQAAASAKAPAAAAAAAQPSGQAWPKRALDRAADVKRQVGEQRNGDETR